MLNRPDGTVHAEFNRQETGFVPGFNHMYTTHEDFAMSTLRPWQGWWSLDVFKDDQQVGKYRFLLADSATRPRFPPKLR